MFAILLGALAIGADVEPAAAGQAPLIITASVKDDKLVSRKNVMEYVTETRTVEVNVNGKIERKTVAVNVPVMKTVMQEWSLKKATMATAGGKKLDLDALKKLMEKPRLVVVSADGKAVGSAYLKLFDKDVIVIVAPPDADKGK